ARAAARLHPNDVRRVVRALEVHALTGKPISEWQTTWDTAAFTDDPAAAPAPASIPAVRLELPRDELYDRINRRVTAMLDAGWLDEARRLRDLPHPLSREARQAVGYRELLEHLETGRAWDETVTLIRTHTRQLAKRQTTWFRHMPACVAIDARAADRADRVLKAWRVLS
ncbi:MAG: tRNA (adenosine(37)-N6)-dimethylallyltransferase, partial [Gemmata sp.]